MKPVPCDNAIDHYNIEQAINLGTKPKNGVSSDIDALVSHGIGGLVTEWSVWAKRGRSIFWAVLILLVLTHCGDSKPTTNPVLSVELSFIDEKLSAKNFSGLAVIMASWCPPCREELPELVKLYRKYYDKGINIIAISIDTDGPGDVQPLINQFQVPFPVYWVGTKAVKHYNLVGIPTMFVVKNGVILEKLPGQHARSTIESKIKELI